MFADVEADRGPIRAVRKLMGLVPNVRTQNAQPLFCTPPAPGQTGWTLTPISTPGAAP